ncbi:glutamine synthetase [Fusarium avenaceum]|nr:glutamine synthetase [Fusarium avenaceum]
MLAKTLLVVTAMAATSLATNLHVNVGCIMVGGTHKLCADDGAYSINGNTAQILCKLDANPTLVTVTWPADYGDVYWNKDDCLVDAEVHALKIGELHWEFRMMDGTSSPYLFVASVLLAALDGVKTETKLLSKDCKFPLQTMSEKKRAEYAMNHSMPTILKEALDHLKNDEASKSWIPADLLKWYISVKVKEVETFGKMSDEQWRLRFLEYF